MSLNSSTDSLSTRVSPSSNNLKKGSKKRDPSAEQSAGSKQKSNVRELKSAPRKKSFQTGYVQKDLCLKEKNLGLNAQKETLNRLKQRSQNGFLGVTGLRCPRGHRKRNIDRNLKKSYENLPFNRFYLLVAAALIAFSWGGWHIGKLAFRTVEQKVDYFVQSVLIKKWVSDVTNPKYKKAQRLSHASELSRKRGNTLISGTNLKSKKNALNRKARKKLSKQEAKIRKLRY